MVSILFLEGPAYAGKTTYLNAQQAPGIVKLPEASEFLGGDGHFPDAPHDVASMLYCSYFFSFMENARLGKIGTLAGSDTAVIADRFTPFSSMVFYYLRYKAGEIGADDYSLGIQLAAKVFTDTLQVPDTPFGHRFMLFTISSQEVFASRLSRGTRNTDFNSWENFRFLAALYKELLPLNTEEVTDGRLTGRESREWEHDSRQLAKLLRPEGFLPAGMSPVRLSQEEMASRIGEYVSKEQVAAIAKRVQELIHE
jgi:hypothetical protein